MTPRRAVALAVAAFAAQAAFAVALLLTGTVTPDHAAGSAGLSAGTSGSYCYADMTSWALSLGCERAP